MSSIFGSLFRSPNVFKNTFKVSNMNLNTKTTKHLTDLVAEHPDLDFPERRYLLPPVLKGSMESSIYR